MSEKLKGALVDVRRAYRLLADYQQRLLELLDFIRDELKFKPYYHEFNSGNTTAPNPHRLAQLDFGGIYALPLLDSYVLWLKQSSKSQDAVNYPQQDDVMISVWLRSDSRGLDVDDGKAWRKTLREKSFKIKDPEESKSELIFAFYVCDGGVQELTNWYNKVFQFKWPSMRNVIEIKDSGTFRIYLDRLDLDSLDSEEAVRREVDALKKRVYDELHVEV